MTSASARRAASVVSVISSDRSCSTPSPADRADHPRLLITISGLPGAGTSTTARLVADALDLERVDGVTVFREMAAEPHLDDHAVSRVAEDDPEIDLELDQRLAVRARAGEVLL